MEKDVSNRHSIGLACLHCQLNTLKVDFEVDAFTLEMLYYSAPDITRSQLPSHTD
jgi:hypothetical protein